MKMHLSRKFLRDFRFTDFRQQVDWLTEQMNRIGLPKVQMAHAMTHLEASEMAHLEMQMKEFIMNLIAELKENNLVTKVKKVNNPRLLSLNIEFEVPPEHWHYPRLQPNFNIHVLFQKNKFVVAADTYALDHNFVEQIWNFHSLQAMKEDSGTILHERFTKKFLVDDLLPANATKDVLLDNINKHILYLKSYEWARDDLEIVAAAIYKGFSWKHASPRLRPLLNLLLPVIRTMKYPWIPKMSEPLRHSQRSVRPGMFPDLCEVDPITMEEIPRDSSPNQFFVFHPPHGDSLICIKKRAFLRQAMEPLNLRHAEGNAPWGRAVLDVEPDYVVFAGTQRYVLRAPQVAALVLHSQQYHHIAIVPTAEVTPPIFGRSTLMRRNTLSGVHGGEDSQQPIFDLQQLNWPHKHSRDERDRQRKSQFFRQQTLA